MHRVLAVAVFCACALQAGEWTKHFQFNGKPDLRVDADDATVTVRPGAVNAIEARITTRGWEIGSDVRVTDHQEGNRLEIAIRVPHSHWNFGSRSIRLDLTVPRDLRADVHTGDGSVNADGIGGELRLITGDGSIEANGLAGALEARTGDGTVRAQGRFSALDVHTGDGSVTVTVSPGSKMTAPWRVHSGDGSVRVQLPSDFAADLDAHTGDGSLTIDLPITTNSVRGDEKTVSGKLNGGGQTLRVETGDGSIHVSRI